MTLFAGSDDYGDGEQRRDFVHVDDAVAVNLWLLENREASGIFNCGTGRAQTFNEVAAAVVNTLNRSSLSIQGLVERKLIQYIPFPPQLAGKYQSYTQADHIPFPPRLVGKYQSYTQADLVLLRKAGCPVEFRPVEQGVTEYVRDLQKR